MTAKDILDRKSIAYKGFIHRLLKSDVADDIAKVILYGSVLRGDATPESDIDLLIIATGEIKDIQRRCSDLSFDLTLEEGELVSTMVYCIDEYRSPHYFLDSVLKSGREVYTVSDEVLRSREAEDLLDLAKKYINMASLILSEENARGVVDFAYNAAELCVKGLLLLRVGSYPKTHSGIVMQFGAEFVKTGLADAELGRSLNRGLDRRNRARYDPHAVITETDAKEMLGLAKAIERLLEERVL